MSNALEQFRAQRKAAEEVLATLQRTSAMLARLQQQATDLSRDRDLLAVLEAERSWLVEARQTVAAVRLLREHERHRYWPAVWRRWILAVAFALASAAAAGAGYAWQTTGALTAAVSPNSECAD
jgi:hypothetical protein